MANYYYATKKTESAPTYAESTTTYDFTADNNGFTAFDREVQVDGPVTANFPLRANAFAIADGAVNGFMSRRNTGSPSSSGSVVGPQDTGNFYIYSEGSGLSNDGVALAQRFCIFVPGTWNRANGLSLTSKVSITRYTVHDARVALYHRPVGGTNTDWVQAGIGPVSLGGTTFVWQDWTAPNVIGPGDPVELMIVFYSLTAVSAWPDKSLFDNGLDRVVLTETTLV